jgi:hypothetical protein
VTARPVAVIRPMPVGVLMGLGPAIRRLGGEAWAAVLDGPEPFPGELDEREWDRIIPAPADAGVLAGRLAGAAGIIATEHTVAMADEVAWRLGLPGNSPKTSPLRRDKGLAAAALADAGLPHPVTVPVSTLDDALAAAGSVTGWPATLKLPASCAADGFALCDGPDELRQAWQRTYGRLSLLGDRIENLLVQRFLPGPQYTVNTVTLRPPGDPPRHLVTDVWWEGMQLLPAAAGVAYVRADLLFPDHPLFDELTCYARRVLDVLGVTWGPAHTELRLDASGQPCAIDVAARLPGYYPQDLLTEALGLSQADAAVLAVTRPAALASRPLSYATPAMAVTQMWMAVPRDGLALDAGVLAEIAGLPEVRHAFDSRSGPADDRLAALAAAGPVAATTDLTSALGGWNLAGSPAAVNAAAEKIRVLEGSLYIGAGDDGPARI